jgi:PBP1b-binding outer membrane lipoprotein LpoB
MAKLGLTKTVVIIILIMSGCSGSEESTVSMEDKVGQLFMIGFQAKP